MCYHINPITIYYFSSFFRITINQHLTLTTVTTGVKIMVTKQQLDSLHNVKNIHHHNHDQLLSSYLPPTIFPSEWIIPFIPTSSSSSSNSSMELLDSNSVLSHPNHHPHNLKNHIDDEKLLTESILSYLLESPSSSIEPQIPKSFIDDHMINDYDDTVRNYKLSDHGFDSKCSSLSNLTTLSRLENDHHYNETTTNFDNHELTKELKLQFINESEMFGVDDSSLLIMNGKVNYNQELIKLSDNDGVAAVVANSNNNNNNDDKERGSTGGITTTLDFITETRPSKRFRSHSAVDLNFPKLPSKKQRL
ncbi:hypothetical protein DFJ63DRAFT_211427 [Scheffersomyces coipomensis]|uniref:uncharacterized protein n=1 Tax=Scheffersomyces coipomensis TaxID=1788519 RepID=UPI00315DFE3D